MKKAVETGGLSKLLESIGRPPISKGRKVRPRRLTGRGPLASPLAGYYSDQGSSAIGSVPSANIRAAISMGRSIMYVLTPATTRQSIAPEK